MRTLKVMCARMGSGIGAPLMISASVPPFISSRQIEMAPSCSGVRRRGGRGGDLVEGAVECDDTLVERVVERPQLEQNLFAHILRDVQRDDLRGAR